MRDLMAGLFIISPGSTPWEEEKQDPVPLMEVAINVELRNFIAHVEMRQKYQNKEKNPIEAVYNFPIEEDAAVIGCSAVLEGETINATIQENKKAEKMYEDAKQNNKTAVMLSSTRPDIFQMKVGNLAPGSECTVSIKYILELPVEDKKTRLTIPTTIAPKYVTSRSHMSAVVPKVLKNILYKEETPAPLIFNMKIAMKTKIVNVTSPSHELITDIQRSANSFEATAKFDGVTADMDRDLIVLIESEEPNQPKIVLEKGSDGSMVAMMSFVPCFELRKQAAEFIFLIDCSGSMGGDSIKIAKEALSVFIHSLPVDAHFNIICFGSSFRKLFPVSKALTDESLAEAKSLVMKIDADLGGTEIYSPLNFIFKLPKVVGKPRQIFVLTDGAVSNSTECVNLVSKHSRDNRVFTLGIGSSADRHLVKGMARAGMGTSAFTSYNENISGKVIKQLKDALQPCIFDVELNWGNDQSAKEFCQAPSKIPPLYDGTRMLVYRMWEENTKLDDKVMIIAKTPEGDLSEEVKIAASDMIEGDMLHTMFARKLIQDLEERNEDQYTEDSDSDDEERMTDESKKIIDKIITDLALKYSLASKKTSFIAISDKANKKEGTIVSRQVHNQVPDRMFGMMAPGSAAPRFRSANFMSRGPPPGCPAPGSAYMGPPPGAPAPGASFFDSMGPPPGAPAPGSSYYPPPGAPAPQSDSSEEMESDEYEERRMESARPTNDMEKILMFASLQNAAGAFKQNKTSISVIGNNLVEKFKKQCEAKGISMEKWWTALVIAFIEKKFTKDKDTWELFVQKGSDWLNDNRLVGEAKLII